MMKRMNAFRICVVVSLLLTGGLLSQRGWAADGVHPDIWLKNEQGDRITPADNRTDPYSPRQSCGGCHSYTTITQGYHFQQGFDVMSDRYNARKPWVLSPGMYGKWLPYAAAGLLAPKANRNPGQMDLAAYDWIGGGKLNPAKKISSPACGWCHPGGGPLEYGRTPEGGADLSRNLIQAEAGNENALDGDFSSRFTPDGLSHFRASGVVEADCLICHLSGYQMERRRGQLASRNYRWAATAGAGLGRIQGAVFTHADPAAGPDHPGFSSGSWNFAVRPKVTYFWNDRRLFTAGGKLQGYLIRKGVGSENCLQCHGGADWKNTGTVNAAPQDAHAKAGLVCTDCHGLVGKTAGDRLRHQIAKGAYPQTSVRDDLDGVGMKTCIGCHREGQYRPSRAGMPKAPPNPERTHAARFPGGALHFTRIVCNACHSTAQPARGMALLDLSAGQEQGFTAEADEAVTWAGDYERARAPWKPWITHAKTGKGDGEILLPHVPKRVQWFGERMGNGEIRPIPLHRVRAAFRILPKSPAIDTVRTDGTKVKIPSVRSDDDILRMITALTKMGFRDVVLLDDRLYALSGGKVIAGKGQIAADSYPVVHGVVPLAQKATLNHLGQYEGCNDCHDKAAPFFTKPYIVNIREHLRQHPEYTGP
jgi:hypothetical protein